MNDNNVIIEKSRQFALSIVRLYRYLFETKGEYIMSKQLMRSGTSIGANAIEADNAQTKADFYAKMYVAYKEANETEYWLGLLRDSEYITDEQYTAYHNDCMELIRILSAITKTQKKK